MGQYTPGPWRWVAKGSMEEDAEEGGFKDKYASLQLIPTSAEALGMQTLVLLPPPMRESIHMALDELGEPQPGYPAPITNAVNILRDALAYYREREERQC